LVRGEQASVRDRAIMRFPDRMETALRTPEWHLIVSPAAALRLYVKPDDRWELNEVADRCHDVAELLAADVPN
jgi:hypothetical protein